MKMKTQLGCVAVAGQPIAMANIMQSSADWLMSESVSMA
jgi:hypothetical protein